MRASCDFTRVMLSEAKHLANYVRLRSMIGTAFRVDVRSLAVFAARDDRGGRARH